MSCYSLSLSFGKVSQGFCFGFKHKNIVGFRKMLPKYTLEYLWLISSIGNLLDHEARSFKKNLRVM